MKKLFITLTLVSLATMSIVLTSVHSQAPQAKFRRARAGQIPNQYLVVLRNDITDVDREVARLMQNSAARLHTYRSAIKGFSVRMSEAQAQRLSQDPRVLFVEEAQIRLVPDRSTIHARLAKARPLLGRPRCVSRVDGRFPRFGQELRSVFHSFRCVQPGVIRSR